MTRKGVVNSIVAAVAILVTGAMAVAAVVNGPPSEAAELVAAGIDGRASVVAELTQSQAESIADPIPPPTVSTPRRPATTSPPAPTTIPLVDSSAPDPLDVDPPATLGPVAAPVPTLPPVPPVPPAGPSSWSTVADGVTVTARIEPVAPRVGDTVTIFYTVEGAGDLCCGSSIQVDNVMVGMNPLPLGPHGCPMRRVTSWSSTIAVSRPGPLTFQVHGSHIERFCTGPPSNPVTVTLHATFQVLPAA